MIVIKLIYSGADINAKDKYGQTLLDITMDEKARQTLRQAGASGTTDNGDKPLVVN